MITQEEVEKAQANYWKTLNSFLRERGWVEDPKWSTWSHHEYFAANLLTNEEAFYCEIGGAWIV